jgi:hypothetical protein
MRLTLPQSNLAEGIRIRRLIVFIKHVAAPMLLTKKSQGIKETALAQMYLIAIAIMPGGSISPMGLQYPILQVSGHRPGTGSTHITANIRHLLGGHHGSHSHTITSLKCSQ